MIPRPPRSTRTCTLLPDTTLFRSVDRVFEQDATSGDTRLPTRAPALPAEALAALEDLGEGLKSMPDLMGKGQGIGSNGWVVDGEHSTTGRSEEHTSELQSLMSRSYAVFCLKKQTTQRQTTHS